MQTVPEETRADVARRRLADLAASFDSRMPAAEHDVPVHRAESRRIGATHVRVVVAVAAAAAVVLAWWLLAARPNSASAGGGLPIPASASASAPAELVIDVTGKVRRPGIITLPAGSRVHEAIEAAGGLAGRVDTSSLNLARKLADGEQVIVGVPAAVGGASAPAGGPLDLNAATPEQLEELPGIGPVTAKAIIDWRTEHGRFASVEDLLDVNGIGEATLDELRDHVRV